MFVELLHAGTELDLEKSTNLEPKTTVTRHGRIAIRRPSELKEKVLSRVSGFS